MKKILWLPSWYPNKTDPFDGDFIQRMAKATALYEKVFVIYVVRSTKISTSVKVETQEQGNLHETIVYYRSSGIFKKIFSWRRYFSLYRKYIKQFITEQGMPDRVHVQVPVKAGMLALWIKRRYGIP